MTTQLTSTDTTSLSTRRLLTVAAASGPAFFAVAIAQMLTREGFDLSRHPISQLATGGPGWIQIANFTAMGAGMIALAVAHRRVVTTGVGRRALPVLLTIFGVGLVGAGVFVMDPEYAFPVGTPDGPAAAMSWHALGHMVATGLAFTALSISCVVYAVRALRQRPRRVLPAVGSIAVAIVCNLPMSLDTYSIQIAVNAAIGFGWASLLALHLRRGV